MSLSARGTKGRSWNGARKALSASFCINCGAHADKAVRAPLAKLSAAVFLVGLLVFSGCKGSKSQKLNPNEQTAFNQAAPELKQIWDKGVEAEKANDYVAAETALYALLSMQLTPEQRTAVEKELTTANQRLFAAAEKGDPSAKAALQQLRLNPLNRPPDRPR